MAKSKQFSDDLSTQALFYMFLLSLQFGIQPILTKNFTPPSICRTSVVLVQEAVKFFFASCMLFGSGNFKSATSDWSVSSWLQVAALPAALYSIQNMAALVAYQNLDALTFNVLNQTKTLSAAMCCYLVMGKKQSKVQILSLIALLCSALVIEKIITLDSILSLTNLPSNMNESEPETIAIQPAEKSSLLKDAFSFFRSNQKQTPTIKEEPLESVTMNFSSRHLTHGVAPVLLASAISGLAGALSQRNLQAISFSLKSDGSSKDKKANVGRNPYLFSMELCAASVIFLCASLLKSGDGALIYEHGFFQNWNLYTLIPIATNACGGIIVGLVTKYAGSVRKGFALIFGILVSGLLQEFIAVFVENDGVSHSEIPKEEIIGGIIAGLSLWAHATHPYQSITNDNTYLQKINPSHDLLKSESTTVPNSNNMMSNKRINRKSRKED